MSDSCMNDAGFPFNDPLCGGCGRELLIENAWMTDGCPCNSPFGVNNQNAERWRLLMQLQQQQQADLTTARAEIERLRAVLRKWLITPEYDFPGDAPELCGFSCLECKSEAATENAIEHKPECVLAAARQEG